MVNSQQNLGQDYSYMDLVIVSVVEALQAWEIPYLASSYC